MYLWHIQAPSVTLTDSFSLVPLRLGGAYRLYPGGQTWGGGLCGPWKQAQDIVARELVSWGLGNML